MNDWGKDYLAHHGIKGMKWGVRRYQNEDGSLTKEGQERYVKKYLTETQLSTAGDSRLDYTKAAERIKKSMSESEQSRLHDRKMQRDGNNTMYRMLNENAETLNRERRTGTLPSDLENMSDKELNKLETDISNAAQHYKNLEDISEQEIAEILYQNSIDIKINTALLKIDNKARAIVDSGKKFIDNLFKKKPKTAVKKPGPTKKTTPAKPRRETK